MAVVLGTSSGFVTVAPSSNPSGTSVGIDNRTRCQRDTSPATAGKIVEVGWYVDNATTDVNYEVGLYDDDTGPDALIFSDKTNAKGAGTGWVSATVDWTISPSTVYYIAVQCDDTTTATNTNYSADAGEYSALDVLTSTLPDPFDPQFTHERVLSIYAVWEEASSGTNTQINIGDAWKTVDGIKINIGDVWKTVAGVQINIGDVWKTVF